MLAHAAGGAWPQEARAAARALSSTKPTASLTHGVRLLRDTRVVFDGRDFMTTAELLDALNRMEDAPWAEWFGRPLTGRGLATLLMPYDIHPQQVRHQAYPDVVRGYRALDVADAWDRYLGPLRSGTSGTSGTEGPVVPYVPLVPVREEGADPGTSTHDDTPREGIGEAVLSLDDSAPEDPHKPADVGTLSWRPPTCLPHGSPHAGPVVSIGGGKYRCDRCYATGHKATA